MARLACAPDLAGAGLDVRVVEASDAPGGRMRTDRRDGFLLDHGFQVFNTSYPQVKKRIALRDLHPRPFTPGTLVHRDGRRIRVNDPTRRPREAAGSAAGAVRFGP
ncbi:FAD-dependent oxidoreductase [Streptomyces sp. NBC_01320]|uniref:FAD-dependent oxidoreductase n=1 Tax=Streptomyces sp. NBC_01320 TaxID=2903824 RepID=UPI003FA368B8